MKKSLKHKITGNVMKALNESFNVDDMGNDVKTDYRNKQNVDKHSKIYNGLIKFRDDVFYRNAKSFDVKSFTDADRQILDTVLYDMDTLDSETNDLVKEMNLMAYIERFYLPQLLDEYVEELLKDMRAPYDLDNGAMIMPTDEKWVRFYDRFLAGIKDENDPLYGHYRTNSETLDFIIQYTPLDYNLNWIDSFNFEDNRYHDITCDEIDSNICLRLHHFISVTPWHYAAKQDAEFYMKYLANIKDEEDQLYACYPVDELADLHYLINGLIETYGEEINLNWIDVSWMADMSYLFCRDNEECRYYDGTSNCMFDGDISLWDVIEIDDMSHMFDGSRFSGDISKWHVNKDCDIECMFDDCDIPYEHRPASLRGRIDESFDVSDIDTGLDLSALNAPASKQKVGKESKIFRYVSNLVSGKYDFKKCLSR